MFQNCAQSLDSNWVQTGRLRLSNCQSMTQELPAGMVLPFPPVIPACASTTGPEPESFYPIPYHQPDKSQHRVASRTRASSSRQVGSRATLRASPTVAAQSIPSGCVGRPRFRAGRHPLLRTPMTHVREWPHLPLSPPAPRPAGACLRRTEHRRQPIHARRAANAPMPRAASRCPPQPTRLATA